MPIKFKLFTGELDFRYIDLLAKIYLFSTLPLYVITYFGVQTVVGDSSLPYRE